MKAICDSCYNPFAATPQERAIRKGVIETFFSCPHCGHHYCAAVTNHQVRKLINELQTLRLSGPPSDKEEPAKHKDKILRLKADIDDKMDDLKRIYCVDKS
ncbi:hypothetical protein AB447_207855 [Bacillus glycinifermentans]|uniref:Transglycosylase n=1 Tax=Bacillus glycinifermentans TaxID=1664069 RepID=A0A0T6BIN4_9BACI|nr:hypothetical protein AB447_207855 [Bacillus glycinifermentans]